MKEIVVETNIGLDDMQIDLIQGIEQDVDDAMGKNGFCRIGTAKTGNSIALRYRQFAVAVPE